MTLTDASVFVVEGFFIREGINCQAGTYGQWVDVRWEIAGWMSSSSSSCEYQGTDVFDYLKVSLDNTERKELYYGSGWFQ